MTLETHEIVNKELISRGEPLTKGLACQVYRVDQKTVVTTGRGCYDEFCAGQNKRTSAQSPEHAHRSRKQPRLYRDGVYRWTTFGRGIGHIRRVAEAERGVPNQEVPRRNSAYRMHCNDQLFDDFPTLSGPFKCEDDFHQSLIAAVKEKGSTTWTELLSASFRLCHSIDSCLSIMISHHGTSLCETHR